MQSLFVLDGLLTVVIVFSSFRCLWWMCTTREDIVTFLRSHHWWYFPVLLALVGAVALGMLLLDLLWAGEAELFCGLLLFAVQMRLWAYHVKPTR